VPNFRNLNDFMNLINAHVWYFMDKETFGEVNKAYADFYGKKPSKFKHRKIVDVLDPSEAKKCISDNRKIFRNKKRVVYKEWKINAIGENRCFLVAKVPKLDPKFNVKYIVCTAFDITKQINIQKALQLSELRYRTILEDLTELICRFKPDGTLTFVNKAYCQYFGKKESELLGKTFFSFIPKEQSIVVKDYLSTFSQNDFVKTIEYQVCLSNGDFRWQEWTDRAIFNTSGEIIEFQSIGRDITEKKETEEHIKRTLDVVEGEVRQRTKQLYKSLKLNEQILESTIQAISKLVEIRDPYTAGHQQRVAFLAEAIALEMGCSEAQKWVIKIAATLHDMGKIFVPIEILNKPGRLNEYEIELIQAHPQMAYDILKAINFPGPVADIVLQHHERLNGSGYPNRKTGEEILLEAKILGVADIVEAMSTHRPYRSAIGIDEALNEIKKGKGILFDPDCVEACLRVVNKCQGDGVTDNTSNLW